MNFGPVNPTEKKHKKVLEKNKNKDTLLLLVFWLSIPIIPYPVQYMTALARCLQLFFRDKDNRHSPHSHDTIDIRVQSHKMVLKEKKQFCRNMSLTVSNSQTGHSKQHPSQHQLNHLLQKCCLEITVKAEFCLQN